MKEEDIASMADTVGSIPNIEAKLDDFAGILTNVELGRSIKAAGKNQSHFDNKNDTNKNAEELKRNEGLLKIFEANLKQARADLGTPLNKLSDIEILKIRDEVQAQKRIASEIQVNRAALASSSSSSASPSLSSSSVAAASGLSKKGELKIGGHRPGNSLPADNTTGTAAGLSSSSSSSSPKAWVPGKLK